MRKHHFRDHSWYGLAVAIAVGVIFYVALSNFNSIWQSINTFLGYFRPVIMGAVIAYIVNPLANAFEKLLADIKQERTRQVAANSLAFLMVILFLTFAGSVLIPQLVKSIQTFISNANGYMTSVNTMLDNWELSKNFNLNGLVTSSEDLLISISDLFVENMGNVANAFASAGKGLFQWLIAFIIAIYLLGEKAKLKTGFSRLLRALVGNQRYQPVSIFLKKCDSICNSYIVYNIIDSLLVGGANAIFMMLFGMQYMGLISFVVGLTNLVPTFGPLVGLVIGGFILFMVNPMHALFFIIFALILQVVDGYILKPRLFGNSLGVSGLWILIGIIVGGNMLGIIGILLAIPCVAIIDFAYKNYLIPGLEKRLKD